MDTNETVETKPVPVTETPSTGGGTLIVVLCGIALVGVAGFALRHELLTKIAIANATQQESIARLTQKITALESQTAALAALPRPDASSIEGLHAGLGSAQDTIKQLTERVIVLEQKPAPVIEVPKPAPAPAPVVKAPVASDTPLVAFIRSGAAYQTELAMWEKDHSNAGPRIAHLRATAASGIASDDMLRSQLRTVLDRVSAPEAPATDDSSTIARINHRLGGLVTIKKQSATAPEISTLRNGIDTVSLTTLVQRVELLPPAQQPFFTAWLEAVRTRDAALAELSALDGAQ